MAALSSARRRFRYRLAASLACTTLVTLTVATSATPADAAPSTSQTLAESWNGIAWTLQPTPSPNGGSELDVVSCPATTNCAAVGDEGGASATLTEAWNGAKWTVVPSPSPGLAKNIVDGVSCASATGCLAVGLADTRALAEAGS